MKVTLGFFSSFCRPKRFQESKSSARPQPSTTQTLRCTWKPCRRRCVCVCSSVSVCVIAHCNPPPTPLNPTSLTLTVLPGLSAEWDHGGETADGEEEEGGQAEEATGEGEEGGQETSAVLSFVSMLRSLALDRLTFAPPRLPLVQLVQLKNLNANSTVAAKVSEGSTGSNALNGHVNHSFRHEPADVQSEWTGQQDDVEQGRGGSSDTHTVILDVSTTSFVDTVAIKILKNVGARF